MKKVMLSKNEWRALTALRDLAGEDGACFYFATIAKQARMRKNDVRLACRSLARKGLTLYERALISDDGGLAGSGYRATAEGLDLFEESDTTVPSDPML